MNDSLYDASAPVFVTGLVNMRAWLDKAAQDGSPDALMEARLAEDMRPLPAQFQMASDSAKNAMARLIGIDPPAMPDTETSFAELQARCEKTIAFIESIDPEALDGAEEREVTLKFPGGMGYRFTGVDYLRRFALPNFYFHASMAYAILRNQGVPLGKPDYLRHLGQPIQL
ncbi:MAG: hypothetical protein B7Z08_04420 [Sphingomonadales bacterium 32-68-7]|nr:MAG: hypothetical protein B7Z33_04845 [Sphingomonadales bacterium 12-68-11]OYX09661.1 MAG: hypothetical protein B7Z08_04420 [Sphingomonadales bacterium 32-68-7]